MASTTVMTTMIPVAFNAAGGSCTGGAWWAFSGGESVVMMFQPFHPTLNYWRVLSVAPAGRDFNSH